MDEGILQALRSWLLGAPGMGQVRRLYLDYTAPQPDQGGLFPAGVTVLGCREDLLGNRVLRCRAQFILRLVLPFAPGADGPAAQNAALLLALAAWVQAQSAAHRAPTLGNDSQERETLHAGPARLETLREGGTAVYRMELTAEYTMRYPGDE